MADRELLRRIDAHMERGNELMAEVVEEHRINRAFQGQQVELMQTVIERNGEAFRGLMVALDRFGARIDSFGERIDSFGERIDAFGERVDAFGERVDAFGATLDLQREILLRFLARLDDGGLPQG